MSMDVVKNASCRWLQQERWALGCGVCVFTFTQTAIPLFLLNVQFEKSKQADSVAYKGRTINRELIAPNKKN
jgi:hypothetical protein